MHTESLGFNPQYTLVCNSSIREDQKFEGCLKYKWSCLKSKEDGRQGGSGREELAAKVGNLGLTSATNSVETTNSHKLSFDSIHI